VQHHKDGVRRRKLWSGGRKLLLQSFGNHISQFFESGMHVIIRLMELRLRLLLRLEQGGLCRRRCSFNAVRLRGNMPAGGVRLSKSTLNTHFGCRTRRRCHNTGPFVQVPMNGYEF
jgi:hypothetical protein